MLGGGRVAGVEHDAELGAHGRTALFEALESRYRWVDLGAGGQQEQEEGSPEHASSSA